MKGENARSSAEARASNAASLPPEAALAMAGFVAGSLSRHVKPLPLACALAAGGLAWRCFTKPRASHRAPTAAPEEPVMFTSEEDFLRHFQAEAAQLEKEAPKAPVAEPTMLSPSTTAAEAEPVPLRTEEDFLRLFQAEMQGVAPESPLKPEPSPFTLVEEPPPEGLIGSALPEQPEASIAAPDPESEAAAPAPTFAIEQVLAAEVPMPLEEVMNRNAAWLLGLEPLPVIEFDEPSPPASSMPAAIPDRIEIPIANQAEAFGAGAHGFLRPSSQGAMAQLLESEPAPALNREAAPEVNVAPPSMPMSEAAAQPAPAEPEIVVPGWLQAQMQRDLMDSFPADVIPRQEPSAPIITPRRVVLKAPVTVPVEHEARNWLNWWK
jgi:hypothetical protein